LQKAEDSVACLCIINFINDKYYSRKSWVLCHNTAKQVVVPKFLLHLSDIEAPCSYCWLQTIVRCFVCSLFLLTLVRQSFHAYPGYNASKSVTISKCKNLILFGGAELSCLIHNSSNDMDVKKCNDVSIWLLGFLKVRFIL
jgi:hypothetical protein